MLAILVPFVVFSAWVLVSGSPALGPTLRSLGPLRDVLGTAAIPVSILAGVSICVRLLPWRQLDATERWFVGSMAVLYFPTMPFALLLWGFAIMRAVYGVSL